MSRSVVSCFAFGCVFVLTVSAFAAPIASVAKPLYAWRTEHDADKTTQAFRHCLVKNMYDNGTLLMIAKNADGARRLAIHFPVDKLSINNTFDVTLQVDGGDIFPTEAVAVTKRILSISAPDALPEQMRKGNILYVRGAPSEDMHYALEGMRGALHALNDCVDTHKPDSAPALADMPAPVEKTDDAVVERMKMADMGKTPPPAMPAVTSAPAMPDPVAKAPMPTLLAAASDQPDHGDDAAAAMPISPPVTAPMTTAAAPATPRVATDAAKPVAPPPVSPPVPPPVPEKTVSLLPSIAAQYSAIGMAPATNGPRALLAAPVDHVWAGPAGVTLGFKRLAGISNADLNAAATQYLRGMKPLCDGPFIAEAATPRLDAVRKTGWIVAEAACAPRQGVDSVIAFAFINAPEGLNIHVFRADAENGAAAITARDALVAHIMK